ncbi:hypothetical protein [Peterkaempfera griseoplana]|uniref:hypothetical protein n=1 Tax=Peterkaempfera griseoplana TaxID=66896 RepID=UPI000ADE3C14|nr:hypothetical protein [Peterkaempfera griseoplana]
MNDVHVDATDAQTGDGGVSRRRIGLGLRFPCAAAGAGAGAVRGPVDRAPAASDA